MTIRLRIPLAVDGVPRELDIDLDDEAAHGERLAPDVERRVLDEARVYLGAHGLYLTAFCRLELDGGAEHFDGVEVRRARIVPDHR